MLRAIRRHATYANVMATIAVFIVIGGTSYAAITLPSNSVGSKQLKSNAVGSKEIKSGAVGSRTIKNGSIRFSDLARATTTALSGVPGPAGPPGPSAVELRAAVSASGAFLAGNATNGGGDGDSAVVGFSRSLAGCVPVATLARNAGGPPGADPAAGRIVVGIEGEHVRVETFNAAGAPDRLPFNLIVTC